MNVTKFLASVALPFNFTAMPWSVPCTRNA